MCAWDGHTAGAAKDQCLQTALAWSEGEGRSHEAPRKQVLTLYQDRPQARMAAVQGALAALAPRAALHFAPSAEES